MTAIQRVPGGSWPPVHYGKRDDIVICDVTVILSSDWLRDLSHALMSMNSMPDLCQKSVRMHFTRNCPKQSICGNTDDIQVSDVIRELAI